MTDVFDRASEREQQMRDEALRAQAKRAGPYIGEAHDWQRLSAKWCAGEGCGMRIADERRQAIPGVRFCVECQTMREEQGRRL